MIIGVTGGSGCGKSSVSRYLESKGLFVIDADKTAREVVEAGKPALKEITEHFGTDVLNDDGTLNRRKLASIVFTDSAELNALNSITHKYIYESIQKSINDNKDKFGEFIIDAAVMDKSGVGNMCDCIVVVLAERQLRIKRIMERDNLTETQAMQRIDMQQSDKEYISQADFILYNNADEKIMHQQADVILKQIREGHWN